LRRAVSRRIARAHGVGVRGGARKIAVQIARCRAGADLRAVAENLVQLRSDVIGGSRPCEIDRTCTRQRYRQRRWKSWGLRVDRCINEIEKSCSSRTCDLRWSELVAQQSISQHALQAV